MPTRPRAWRVDHLAATWVQVMQKVASSKAADCSPAVEEEVQFSAENIADDEAEVDHAC